MPNPKIAFHPTPNPHAGKFTVGRTLVEGRSGKSFDTPASAADEPIAARLMAEPGVESVFMVADFVTVTKELAADWRELAPRIVAALNSVA